MSRLYERTFDGSAEDISHDPLNCADRRGHHETNVRGGIDLEIDDRRRIFADRGRHAVGVGKHRKLAVRPGVDLERPCVRWLTGDASGRGVGPVQCNPTDAGVDERASGWIDHIAANLRGFSAVFNGPDVASSACGSARRLRRDRAAVLPTDAEQHQRYTAENQGDALT